MLYETVFDYMTGRRNALRLRFKSILILLFTAALVCFASGCVAGNPDELYCVPRASERFLQLQEKIDEEIAAGAVYAPPESGYNRQSVQLQDLDGDGKGEAIAFFKVSGEKPLKIYVFREVNGEFERSIVIEGGGTAFDSVVYVDMDKDGVRELVVGWQMGTAVKTLSMYAIREQQPVELTSTVYSEYTVTDLDSDGDYEVFTLRFAEPDHGGSAEVYNLMNDGEIVTASARLSKEASAVQRIMSGKLTDSTPAIFVDSVYTGGNVITDVFMMKDAHSLSNLTLKPNSNASTGTIRGSSIYCSDINEDGIMDVPIPRQLHRQTETIYYSIDWYSYEKSGLPKLTMTTYHNYFDGWYLVIPSDWVGNVSVRREDSAAGERTIVFSRITEKEKSRGVFEVEDFLKIYALSGDNKRDMANISGRFRLITRADTIYAAEILVNAEEYALRLNEQMVRDNFHIIYSDWITGDI